MIQEIFSGYNSHCYIKKILNNISPGCIFLVTGKKSYNLSGAKELLSKVLKDYKIIQFNDFEVNPKVEDIKKGVSIFNDSGCDFIIAVGGGSVIDVAKAISILSANNQDISNAITGEIELCPRQYPLLIIPTTAGTGSESTHFSVVYLGKDKYSFAQKTMLPDYVVLDSVFTKSLPAYITACTAMDALCQGIESYWSVHSTEESREYSKQSICIILDNINRVVGDPDDESREKMLIASNLAGKAINIAKTTAPHAVSYPITSFFNIPHGHAVALTLPYFLEFNSLIDVKSIQDPRGVGFVENIMHDLFLMMKVASAKEAKNKFINIMKDIKLKTSFGSLGITVDAIEIIVENGFNPQRIINNPKFISKKELYTLLKKCY